VSPNGDIGVSPSNGDMMSPIDFQIFFGLNPQQIFQNGGIKSKGLEIISLIMFTQFY
jgi:hypothetical protein